MKSASYLRTTKKHKRNNLTSRPLNYRSKSDPLIRNATKKNSKNLASTYPHPASTPGNSARQTLVVAKPKAKEAEDQSDVSTSDSLAICLFGFAWERENTRSGTDHEKGQERETRSIGDYNGWNNRDKFLDTMYDTEYEDEVRKQAVMSVSSRSATLFS
jgi:hypothetical protein